MKRFAPIAIVLAAALLVVILSRDPANTLRTTSAPVQSAPPETTTEIILPATSDAWTKLATPPLVASGRKQFLEAATNISPAISPVSLDEQRKQARARQLLAQGVLASVGLDADSDQLWLAAVTDENLTPDERRGLILALHDPTVEDPTRLTQRDLALIAGRVALIEQAAPAAVDSADGAALQEVHQELLSLIASASAPATPATAPLE